MDKPGKASVMARESYLRLCMLVLVIPLLVEGGALVGQCRKGYVIMTSVILYHLKSVKKLEDGGDLCITG